MKKFQSGAASFYIVAFSTLLLTIIAVSFATIILSELNRSSKSDLSQSAYDSALAGIEDAKAAFLNYQSCLNQGFKSLNIGESIKPSGNITCSEIISYMEWQQSKAKGIGNLGEECDVVGHILGRIGKGESSEVVIQETATAGNNLAQAYTCVKVRTVLDDYRSQLTSDDNSRLIRVQLSSAANASDITSLRLSWYSDNNGTDFNFSNFDAAKNSVVFPRLSESKIATPPTISIQLFQTATSFTLNQLDSTIGDQTDRGTIFLVPVRETDNASGNNRASGFIGAYNNDNDDNIIDKNGFLKSNNQTATNVPYTVYCPGTSGKEFACSVSIALPNPVGGPRSADTFMFVVSLPYGQPDTDFSLELCTDNAICSQIAYSDYATGDPSNTKVPFSGTQISIDSTGRADILFRRVEARLDTTDIYFPHPEYAIQLLGDGTTLQKTFYTTTEYNF